jgi:predicted RNA-binding Zn ribbon-like protein
MSSVPATDPWLGFVLDFCNTYDLLEDPPDRLTIPLVSRLATHNELAALDLVETDLEPVRAVRDQLYRVFAEADAQTQYGVLNRLFDQYGATPRLVEGPRLAATGGADPVARLAVSAADALARAIAGGSAGRLRTCAGDPCRCVYVDRTKANRRRYCCELCNDRMASAAYRSRKN